MVAGSGPEVQRSLLRGKVIFSMAMGGRFKYGI